MDLVASRGGRGLTLVETLVALALFSMVALSIIPAFTTHTDSNTRSEARSDAVTMAQQQLEALRARALDTMPVGGPPESATVSVAGRNYEVLTRFCEDTQFCPPVSPGSRHLTVEVYLEGHRIYDAATVFTDLD